MQDPIINISATGRTASGYGRPSIYSARIDPVKPAVFRPKASDPRESARLAALAAGQAKEKALVASLILIVIMIILGAFVFASLAALSSWSRDAESGPDVDSNISTHL